MLGVLVEVSTGWLRKRNVTKLPNVVLLEGHWGTHSGSGLQASPRPQGKLEPLPQKAKGQRLCGQAGRCRGTAFSWPLSQQEEAKNFITRENLEARVEEALDSPKSYNWAVTREGLVVRPQHKGS